MSARDDYPLLALHADDRYAVPSKQTEIVRALNEIDRLREKLNRALDLLAEDDLSMARFMGLA